MSFSIPTSLPDDLSVELPKTPAQEAPPRSRSRREACIAALRTFVNHAGIKHEMLVVAVSYLFIFAGAWNDGFLGMPVSLWPRVAEWCMALVLSAEILSRMLFSERRDTRFWLFLIFDCISVLTLIPSFKWLTFARVPRAGYAGLRLISLLDSLARHNGNPMYLVGLYPASVPLFACVVYGAERGTSGSAIHSYTDALSVCFAFALTLGNLRPVSTLGMLVCGFVFLLGLVCLGMLSNMISARYQCRCDGQAQSVGAAVDSSAAKR